MPRQHPACRRVSRSGDGGWNAAGSLPTVAARGPILSADSAQTARRALVIRGIKVIMRPLTGFARGPSLPQPVDLPGPTVVAGMVAPESTEASRVMSESEQRQG